MICKAVNVLYIAKVNVLT